MKKLAKMIGTIVLYMALFFLVLLAVGFSLRTARNIGLIKRETLQLWVEKYDLLIMSVQCVLATGVYALYFRLRKQRITKYCKINSMNSKSTFYSFVVALAMGIFSTSFIELSMVQANIPELGETVYFFMGRGSIIIAILSSVFIVPAFEELLFRGLVFSELKKAIPLVWALLLQSALYAIIQPNVPAMIFGFFGGILFALGYHWTKSFWSPVIMQTISCLFMLIFRRTGFNTVLGGFSDVVLIIIIAVSLITVWYAMIQIRKNKVQDKPSLANTLSI